MNAPAPHPHRCTLACIFSVNRWDPLVGTIPTERKSRIRNNEPREPRGLTRAVKLLWLYSAASLLLFSFALARSCLFWFPPPFSLRAFHPFSSPLFFLSTARLLPFPHIAIYILLHAIALIPRLVPAVRRILYLRSSLDDNGDNSANYSSWILGWSFSRWKDPVFKAREKYHCIIIQVTFKSTKRNVCREDYTITSLPCQLVSEEGSRDRCH